MAIDYLIPDMPSADELLPYLQMMDQQRYYTNFGPLYRRFKTALCEEYFPDWPEQQVTLVSSGTAAIELGLRSLQLSPGSQILMPVYTFPATAQAVLNCGLEPVFADVDPDSFQLTPAIASQSLDRHQIAAVLPVSLGGLPVNAEAWAEFSRHTQLPVVVDAAPALENQPLVAGLSYAFSLHATKPFGIGEGGVLVDTRDNAASLTLCTNFGFFDGDIACQGGNYKVSEYHCAVGLAQLARLPQIRKTREAIYQGYQQVFEDSGLPLIQQHNENGMIPSNLMVAVEGVSAKVLSEGLWANDIICRRQFWPLLCDHSFSFTDQPREAFPVAITLSEKMICLPFHNFLSHKDMETVVGQLLKAATDKRVDEFKNNDLPSTQQ